MRFSTISFALFGSSMASLVIDQNMADMPGMEAMAAVSPVAMAAAASTTMTMSMASGMTMPESLTTMTETVGGKTTTMTMTVGGSMAATTTMATTSMTGMRMNAGSRNQVGAGAGVAGLAFGMAYGLL